MVSAPRIIGRYSIHDEIGVGGMSSVHLGRLVGAAGFSRVVAIKRLHPHLARATKFVEAFVDEARLAARIRHPNVVQTLDVVADDDEILIVMEYVAGAALSELGRPSPAIACAIAWSMLNGLHAAHSTCDEHGRPLGIVHRDVSPQNVLVGTDGLARVLDFGIAKADRTLHATVPGEIKGKPAYMAPEQLVLECSSAKSDLYSTGVVLWELLTGRPLYEGSVQSIIHDKTSGPAPPRPSAVADVADALDAVVGRALRKNPDERFATAQEFAVALEETVPIAGGREVKEWLARDAAELLARRAAVVAAVERGPHPEEATAARRSPVRASRARTTARHLPSGVARAAGAEAPTESSERAAATDDALVAFVPSTKPWLATTLVATAAVVLMAGFGAWRAGWIATGASAAEEVGPPVPAAPGAPDPQEPRPVPSPAAPSVAAFPASPASAPAPSRSSSEARPVAPPRATASKPSGRAAAAARCAPPFWMDDGGIKHLKPECL